MKIQRLGTRIALVFLLIAIPTAAQEPVKKFEDRTAEQWVTWLASKDVAERRKAVYALYKLEWAARPHVRVIAKRLQDSDKYVRDTAAQLLGRWKFGSVINVLPEALPELLDALKDQRSDVRIATINLIWNAGPIPNVVGGEPPPATLVPALTAALADSEPKVRANAAACLLNVAKHAGPAEPALAKALDDDDATVRLWVMRAAPNIDAAWACALALKHLDDPDVPVRIAIAAALGTAGADASDEVHGALGKLIADKAEAVQVAAVDGLWAIGDERAARRLIDVVQGTGSAAARGRAAMALGGLGDPAVLPILQSALDDDAPLVRSGAAAGLGRLGPEAAVAVPRVVEQLASTDAGVRSNALTAAAGLAPWAAAAVPGVVRIASDAGSPQRNFAMSTLYAFAQAGHRDPSMLTCAIAALEDEDRSADVYAIQVVAEFEEKAAAALPVLRRLLAPDSYWQARRSLFWAALRMGAAAEPLADLLAEELKRIDGDALGAALVLLRVSKDEATRDRATAIVVRNMKGEQAIRALVGLMKVGVHAEAVRTAVRSSMKQASRTQVWAAAILLQCGGDDEAAATAWFNEQLGDAPSLSILNALRDVGPAARALQPALLKIALDPNQKQRTAALRALRAVGATGESVQAAYALARKDKNPYIRTLGELGLRSLR